MKENRKSFKVRYSDGVNELTQIITAPTAEKARQMFIDSYANSSLGVILEILDITL